jgi:lysophospholipase L1-like esterase
LQQTWPDRTIEAVNAAAMSYGSHRLRILAAELAGYSPDLFIVYGGHNEFVERRFYERILDRPTRLDALRAVLYRSRIFSLMSDLLESAPDKMDADDSSAETTGVLLGLDVEREYSVDVAAAERAEVEEYFAENLKAIVKLAREAGARVVLCTVPSNVREWIPNQSRFDDEVSFDDRQTVLGLLTEAKATLPSRPLASLRITSKQAFWSAGLPRQWDARTTRASSELNEILRRVAAQEGTVLLDLEVAFAEASPGGLVGFNLLEDYVHPKPEGHRLITMTLRRATASVLTAPTPAGLWELRSGLFEAGVPAEDPIWGIVGEFHKFLDELGTRSSSREYSQLASKLDISAAGCSIGCCFRPCRPRPGAPPRRSCSA